MTAQTDPEGTEARMLRRYAGLSGDPSKAVLEVGSGDGRLTWRYASGAGQVIGIDLERDDLRLAMADRPGNLNARVIFAQADAEHLPFAPSSFDVAIFAWSF